MSYDIYKEFNNYSSNSDSSNSFTKSHKRQGEIAYESVQGLPSIGNRIESYEYFRNLDKIYPTNSIMINGCYKYIIGMEAGDDPFADVGADNAAFGDDSGGSMDAGDAFASGGDDPFGSVGSDDPFGGGDDSSDPFGSIGGDDGGDPFGDMGGGEDSEQKQASQQIKLDREKAIKEDYDLSRQIRSNFPKKFLKIKDIISNNVTILERTVIADEKFTPIITKMVDEYERITDIINTYLEVIPRKTYEDIFGTYVSVHSALMRLKKAYMKLTNFENPEVMKDLENYDYDTEEINDNVDPDDTSV